MEKKPLLSATTEKSLMDLEEVLAKEGVQVTEQTREVLKQAINEDVSKDREKHRAALEFASRMARSLLSELAPGELPVLGFTIEPNDDEFLDLADFYRGEDMVQGLQAKGIQISAEAKAAIIQTQVNQDLQSAAFTLGLAIGMQLAGQK